MKKIHRQIDYRETGVYKVNNLTERYYYNWFDKKEFFWLHILYLSSYEICNVYTDKNTVLDAYKKLNGAEATYQVILDSERKRDYISHRKQILDLIHYNDYYNCHGFTFLKGLFWFELHNEKLNKILADDNYIPCKREDLEEGGICLFYNQSGNILHSGRVVDGVIQSKFGINDILTQGEEEVYKKYQTLKIDRNQTLFYNPHEKVERIVKKN